MTYKVSTFGAKKEVMKPKAASTLPIIEMDRQSKRWAKALTTGPIQVEFKWYLAVGGNRFTRANMPEKRSHFWIVTTSDN